MTIISWTQLKAFATSKKLAIQYADRGNYYDTYLVDNTFFVTAVIDKVVSNADLIDFETNFLPTANQKIEDTVRDILNKTGDQGSLAVGVSAVEIKVGASRLAGRKSVTLYNNSNQTVFWGYTSGVTTSSGTPIEKSQFVTWEVGEDLAVFVIAATAGNNVRITEAG